MVTPTLKPLFNLNLQLQLTAITPGLASHHEISGHLG